MKKIILKTLMRFRRSGAGRLTLSLTKKTRNVARATIGWVKRNKKTLLWTGAAAAAVTATGYLVSRWMSRKEDAHAFEPFTRDADGILTEGGMNEKVQHHFRNLMQNLNRLSLNGTVQQTQQLKIVSAAVAHFVQMLNYLPHETVSSYAMTALKTYTQLSEVGLTFQEDPQSDMLVRTLINGSEDATDPYFTDDCLVAAIEAAASGAPLRHI